MRHELIIVGAGLAGVALAHALHVDGHAPRVLEARAERTATIAFCARGAM